METRFKQTVDSGDLVGTRISLANEMMLDPRGESFREMRAYAESVFPNLYEVHNGAVLEKDRNKWNEDLLFNTRNDLDDNFSRERLDHYYNMAQVVLETKGQGLEKKRTRSPHDNKRPQNTGKSIKGNAPLYLGLTVGGLVLGGSGLVLGRVALATIGLIGAAIGGGLLYKNSKA